MPLRQHLKKWWIKLGPIDLDELEVAYTDLLTGLGVANSTMDDWIKSGQFPEPTKKTPKTFKVGPFLRALINYLRTEKKKPAALSAEKVGLTAAKIRLLVAQAQNQELQYLKATGAVVDLEATIAHAVKNARVARIALENLPTRLAPTLAVISDPLEIRDILTSEINNALREIVNGLEIPD